jgi:excisionase family DNA binding protein
MNTENQNLPPLANSIPDTRRRLGVSQSTLYRLMTSGELKGFMVGGRRFFSEAELINFVKQKEGAQ